MEIIWKDIPGYEGFYQVSNTGLVRSLDRVVLRRGNGKNSNWNLKGRIIKPHLSKSGYLRVPLYISIRKYPSVHRMVTEAFIGCIPIDREVNHKDGNKLNNLYNNLEIVTRSENNYHAYKTGLRKPYAGKNK